MINETFIEEGTQISQTQDRLPLGQKTKEDEIESEEDEIKSDDEETTQEEIVTLSSYEMKKRRAKLRKQLELEEKEERENEEREENRKKEEVMRKKKVKNSNKPNDVIENTEDKEKNTKDKVLCRHFNKGNYKHGMLGNTPRDGIKKCPFQHPKVCHKWLNNGANKNHPK